MLRYFRIYNGYNGRGCFLLGHVTIDIAIHWVNDRRIRERYRRIGGSWRCRSRIKGGSWRDRVIKLGLFGS